MKYSILTFGCRTNQADSSHLERQLRLGGGDETHFECADLVVVNTCAVTSTAEQAARQAIRRIRRLNPAARVVATGCYATRAPLEVRSIADDICSCFDRLSTNGNVQTEIGSAGTHPFVLSLSKHERGVAEQRTIAAPMAGPGARGRTLHLLRVQAGCDERCAYCIVPSTRGPSRSVPMDTVLSEVAEAASAGFKEATITGVHLGCYGRDLRPATSLAQLLRALVSDPSELRFRLSAIEPMDFDEDVVAAAADRGRFAAHFHLPLQHASDRVLAAMRRPYTLDRYRLILARLLDARPDAAVGADVIVGFPGETDADFQACVDYLEASPLAYVHVFPFSPRPGTAAARMAGRPRGEDVRRRVAHLRGIGAQLSRRFRARFVGTVRDGLTIEDGTLALTDNYLRVRIAPGLPRNERVKVRIVADGEPMTGQNVK